MSTMSLSVGTEPRRAVNTARARVGESVLRKGTLVNHVGIFKPIKGHSDSDASAGMPTVPKPLARFKLSLAGVPAMSTSSLTVGTEPRRAGGSPSTPHSGGGEERDPTTFRAVSSAAMPTVPKPYEFGRPSRPGRSWEWWCAVIGPATSLRWTPF